MAKGKGNKSVFGRKSLKRHFFGKSLVVGLCLLSLTMTALFAMLSSYGTHHNERQALRLARSIDAVAVFTSRPNHLQHFLRNIRDAAAASQIVVVSKHNLEITASTDPRFAGPGGRKLPPALRSAVAHAFATNVFHPTVRLPSGASYAILPLSSAAGQLDGDYPYGLAEPMMPKWYGLVDAAIPSLPDRIWSPSSHLLKPFSTQARTYSGAIIVRHGSLTTGGLLLDVLIETSALIIICFIALIVAGWSICRRYVTRPVNELGHVLAKLRSGDRQARAPRFRVREFDRLARQWNSLLNSRQSAEQHNEVFSTIIENVPVGIEVSTPDGRIEYANPAFQKMCGKPLMEIVGKTPAQIFRSEGMDATVLAEAENHIGAGRPWRGEIRSRIASGKTAVFDVHLRPVIDAQGKAGKVVAVRQDITERIEYQQALIQAKRKSDAADKAKSDFINRLSHELRTPFNAIIGFASLIYNQQAGPISNPTYLEFATLIEKSANGLLATINTLIELSRIVQPISNRGDATMGPGSTVHRVVRAKQDKAAVCQVTMTLHDELDGAGVLCDERHLQSMIENLLCNALKFNHPGGRVDITVKLDDENRFVLEVADTGIGIGQDDIGRIAEPFFQAANGAGREHDGLGVGLTLVQHLVNIYDAELKVISDHGTGTRMKIVFPANRTVEPGKTTLAA